MFKSPLILFSLLAVGTAGASPCRELLDLNRSDTEKFRFVLPDPQSEEFRTMSRDIQLQIQTKGFATVDLSKIFTEELGRHWYGQLSKDRPENFIFGTTPVVEVPKLSPSGPDWLAEGLKDFYSWTHKLISDATSLPVYDSHVWAEARVSSKAGSQDILFPQWHLDGNDVNFALTLLGSGTEVLGVAPKYNKKIDYRRFGDRNWESLCARCEPIRLSRGQLLIFFGQTPWINGNYPALIHRSPIEKQQRIFLIGRT